MKERKYLIDNIQLMREYNFEKNLDIDINKITLGMHLELWWKCENGHEWKQKIYSRASGYKCPYCSGKRAIKGVNDFQTIHPELMKEWDYKKNNDLKPDEVLPSINKKVWWKCYKGHEWQATLNNRHNGTGCPVCSKELSTSFPEMSIVYYLNKCVKLENRKKIEGKELDIYIPTLNLGIEYDGMYYHKKTKAIERDREKNVFFHKKGIELIRIKESNVNIFDKKANIFYFIPNNNYSNLNIVIKELLNYINERYHLELNIEVDLDKDRIEILNQFKEMKRENSITNKRKILTEEWNYNRNKNLQPDFFDIGSKHRVWWICKKGHEWQASIYSRSYGAGCPYCANQKVLKGYNDLKTLHPRIANEWNYEKNKNLTPEEVIQGSSTKYWWKCYKGHEWKTAVSNRINGNNCPYCANKKVLAGYNDLKTWCNNNDKTYLIEEFDYQKNCFNIDEITYASSKKVWWICPRKHSYLTYLTHRTQMNTNCPYCSHKKLLTGYNDLATTHPEIAKEWDYQKNDNITPRDVMAGSNIRKYWFLCKNGHSYYSTLLNRKRSKGCPICKIKKMG